MQESRPGSVADGPPSGRFRFRINGIAAAFLNRVGRGRSAAGRRGRRHGGRCGVWSRPCAGRRFRGRQEVLRAADVDFGRPHYWTSSRHGSRRRFTRLQFVRRQEVLRAVDIDLGRPHHRTSFWHGWPHLKRSGGSRRLSPGRFQISNAGDQDQRNDHCTNPWPSPSRLTCTTPRRQCARVASIGPHQRPEVERLRAARLSCDGPGDTDHRGKAWLNHARRLQRRLVAATRPPSSRDRREPRFARRAAQRS